MPPADRKRKIHKTNAKAVDSISFDFDSRQEYLTGFHKRKVQRAEHGRELAQRKEKEAVVQARKEVRMRSHGSFSSIGEQYTNVAFATR